MVEKVGHIKNPLSVIAIFAAIAEISGTTILPFISPENQEVYIWFLMIFPIFLVGIFFLTLNFNHKVLYAPSDYKDENNFLKLFDKASPEEQKQKLWEEVIESAEEITDPDEIDGQTISVAIPIDSHANKDRQLMASVTLAEKLAINSLSKKLNLKFKTDVKMELNGRVILFDALAIDGNVVHAVEVKLFKSEKTTSSRFEKILLQFENFQNDAKDMDSKKFILHLYAVVDNPKIDQNKLKEQLEKFNAKYNININLKVITLNDLQNEWQYG